MIQRAYYQSSIRDFLEASESEILGELAGNNTFGLDASQRNAWQEQIAILKIHLKIVPDGVIFLEFSIPRMGKRVDVLLVIGAVIFVLEFKIGAKHYDSYAVEQAMDYALDLKNFHEGSHDKYLVPVLVATRASELTTPMEWSSDNISSVRFSNEDNLAEILRLVLLSLAQQDNIDAEQWSASGYKPTPTIVEAARALYQNHSVEEISRSDAGATNLSATSKCISEIIDHSAKVGRKSICFVTGVPGAGKTLAGLNISTQRLRGHGKGYAVFLSGNGPLVIVLREALARDEVNRAQEMHQIVSKKAATARVSTFIQNVHHFRDESLKSVTEPIEHVVVFDEAQRAWNQSSAEKFMIQKRGKASFDMSEPEFLMSVMDRKSDWCTVICLIGGGQEINTGEAGLVEWVEALEKRFNHWDVYHSDQVAQKDYSWERDIVSKLSRLKSREEKALHLAVSIRSFRAEQLSAFVGAVIDGNADSARNIYATIRRHYPIFLTRNIVEARAWLRAQARGSERFGLVASSGAIRLKPEGVNVRASIEPVPWFLNDKSDVRSSFYLEDAATEFDIQGLELDWAGVCWDADFRREDKCWALYSFKGTRWQSVNDPFRKIYLANAYRVLMTRARQGMVIFVPKGDDNDDTRLSWFYDGTFDFLSSCGLIV